VGDLLESANLALVIQLVVQGTLNSGVHGSGPLDGRVSGLAGHAVWDRDKGERCPMDR
jgi:hypothetical protein